MKSKNLSPERRIPRTLKDIGLIIGIFVFLGIVLIALDMFFGIKVSGISYPALSKIMMTKIMMTGGTVIYIGVMGYFLKKFIKESMDKKLTFWQKIVKWNFIILITGAISSMIVMTNWLSFSSDLMRVLSIILSIIMLLSVTIIIIYYLFGEGRMLFK